VVVDFVIDRTIPRVVAEFTSQVQRGVVPFAMSFQDLSNNATAWAWDFGDGGSSTEQHPTHVYTVPGDYTVALTVSGTVGSATATKPAFAQATATPRTWATIYAENALSSGCATASCHTGLQTSVTFSMTSATTAYTNLVGINSVLGCMPQKRVLVGNSAQSGLVFAISDPPQCVSFRMGSLSPQAVHDVIDWINNGAPQ
jgi:PKD repeat protein